jgi:hypothetical protein
MTTEQLAKFIRDEVVSAMKQDPAWRMETFKPWREETDRKAAIYRKVAEALMQKFELKERA